MEENLENQDLQEKQQTNIPQEEKEMNFFERVINVYFSPVKAFQSVVRKQDWIWVYMILIVLAFSAQLVTKDVIVNERIDRIERSDRLTPEQKDNQIEYTRKMYEPPFIYIIIVTMLLGGLVWNAAAAGILLFTGNIIFGGEAKFKQMFSMYIYTGLVGIPNLLLKAPLIMSKGTSNVQTSLAVFMSVDSMETFLYRFLTHIDVFAIWQVILVAIGFSLIYKFEFKKSITIIALLQLIYSIVTAAGGSLLGGIGG